MIRALSCAFSVVALATALFADDAEEAKTLRDELAALRFAEQAIQEAASSDDDVGKMTKLLRDESLAKVYDKWSKKKWDEAVKRFEKDISTANREYRVPKVPTTAAEEMILILEPNLSLLKKKYESMDKGASGRADLKKQIEAQEKKIVELKKDALAERSEFVRRFHEAKGDRRAEFERIAKRIEKEIESNASALIEDKLRPIEFRLEAKKKAEETKKQAEYDANYQKIIAEIKQEEDKKNARLAKEKRAEATRLKKAQGELDAAYRVKKVWYNQQLDYYGLQEADCTVRAHRGGNGYYLTFFDCSSTRLTISAYPINGGRQYELQWDRFFAKGFAEELMEARIVIYKYENPDWLDKYRKGLVEAEKREKEEEKKFSFLSDDEKKKKTYAPKKRRINPDLKRFKGPGDR